MLTAERELSISSTISLLQSYAFLDCSQFEQGSGTPTPHTSTTPHLTVEAAGDLTFPLGKLHLRDFYTVACAHASLRLAANMVLGYLRL